MLKRRQKYTRERHERKSNEVGWFISNKKYDDEFSLSLSLSLRAPHKTTTRVTREQKARRRRDENALLFPRGFGEASFFFSFLLLFFCFLSCFALRKASANEFSMTARTPKLELSSSHSSSSSTQALEKGGGLLETNESLVVRARLENGKGYERKVYLKFLLGTTTSNEEEKFEKMRDDGKYPDETANDGVYAVAVDVRKELGAKNGDVVLFRAEGVDGERRQKAVAFAEGRREERRPGSHRGF